MTVIRQLLIVEAAALVALLAVSVGMAGYGAFDSLLHSNSLLTPASSAQILFVYTAIFGLVPVIAIGAPGYVALLRHNRARWQYVVLLGIAPGLVALSVEPSLGFLAIICGAAVAAITHLICRRLGPNNSFKPKPKPRRGSA